MYLQCPSLLTEDVILQQWVVVAARVRPQKRRLAELVDYAAAAALRPLGGVTAGRLLGGARAATHPSALLCTCTRIVFRSRGVYAIGTRPSTFCTLTQHVPPRKPETLSEVCRPLNRNLSVEISRHRRWSARAGRGVMTQRRRACLPVQYERDLGVCVCGMYGTNVFNLYCGCVLQNPLTPNPKFTHTAHYK